MSRVFAVVPAHNESANIADTVCALQAFASEVLVVADACRDDTAERAREAGAEVLVRTGRGDKARALAAGLLWVDAHSPDSDDIVLLVDADTRGSAGQALQLVEAIAEGPSDGVIGVLPPAGRQGGFGLVARLARWLLWWKTGRVFRAPLSGQRALRWSACRRLRALAGGFGVEVGMTIDLVRAGALLHEVDVPMTHRYTGRGWRGFLHRARQGWHVILATLGFRRVRLWMDSR